MGKTVEEWTDARLNHLADALEPIPVQVAALTATVDHVRHVCTVLEPVPTRAGRAVRRR